MRIYLYKFIAAAAIILMAASCEVSDIIRYDMKNSAVAFKGRTHNFSLKGMSEDTRELTVPLSLIGPVSDVDRAIDLEFITEGVQDAAKEGTDYEFLGAEVKAGELSGALRLRVNRLDIDTPRKAIRVAIVPNESFTILPNEAADAIDYYKATTITWSNEYTRPAQRVWRYWHMYFSKYYSKALHEIYCQIFTDEIEYYTRDTKDIEEGLISMNHFWWTSASQKIYSYVREHDKANPDSPLMHSEDWLYYSSYTIADGEGTKNTEGGRIPTILETLLIF